MKTDLIISGGLGFIGTSFLNIFRKKFGRIIVLDNLLPQVHKSTMKSYSKDDVEFYCVDILENLTLIQAFI